MKKVFKSLILLASSALLLAGCAKEMQGPKGLDGDAQQVTFTASIPQEMTKAVADGDGDGDYVNRCIMEIYYGDDLFTRMYSVVDATAKTASFSTQLVANRTYTVAFWADHVDAAASTPTSDELAVDKFYVTANGLKAVALSGTYAGNNDMRDAFFHCDSYEVEQGGSSFSDIILYRPFAQVNVITTDLQTIKPAPALKPTGVIVTLKNAYTAFNVVTGEVGTQADIAYTGSLYNFPETIGDDTEATLSMDYLFASSDKAVIDIDWKATKSGDTNVAHSFTNIPYQRNYRTNIKGALLTTTGQWNVTVEPTWSTPAIDVAFTVVNDIASANDFVAANTSKKEISVTFSSQPADAGDPTTSGKNAIVTSLLAENAVYNIDVASSNEVLYVGDYDYTTSGSTTTYDYTTILEATDEKTKAASVNLVVTSTQYIGTLVVNSPSKSVSINGQTLASGKTYHIENLTVEEVSMNTVIIESGMSVTNLTMKKGGLEIHGTVTNVSIPQDHGTIVVRDCENLSQAVYDVLDDYIAEGYFSEKGKTTADKWDIYPGPCKIGTTYYATLAAAFAAVNNDETIVMVQDVVLKEGQTVTTNSGVSFSLDLNGKTISIAETGFDFSKNGTSSTVGSIPARFAFVVKGEGTMNICDSSAGELGTITAPDHDYGTVKAILVNGNAIVNVNSGNISGGYAAFYAIGYTGTTPVDPATAPKPTLNINGGKVLGGSSAIGLKGNTAKLSISAGIVESTGYYGVVTNGTQDWYDGGNSCITISGGTIKGTLGAAMYLPAESPTTITGGYFEGTEGIVAKGGSVTITGASVVINATGAYKEAAAAESGYTETGSCIYVEDTYSGHAPVVNISAGKFYSKNNLAVQYYTTKEASAQDKGYIALTGGSYSTKPADDCIASGYGAVETGDATYPYKVAYTTSVASIGNVKFSSLADAFAVVQEGQTITLAADCETGSNYTINNALVLSTDNVTLDLNGNSLTVNNNFSFILAGDGITLKNGNIVAGYCEEKVSDIISYSITVAAKDAGTFVNGVTLDGLNVTGGIRFGGDESVQYKGGATAGVVKDCIVEAGDFYCIWAEQNSTATVKSGKFKDRNIYGCAVSAANGSTISLEGGIYSDNTNLSNYAAYGHTVVDNTEESTKTDYPYSVVVSDYWPDYAAASFSSISGQTINITTAEELALFAKTYTSYSGYTVNLSNDIDLSAHYWVPFKGVNTIDGMNHTIDGMKIKDFGSYNGFISIAYNEIKDIKFTNASVKGVRAAVVAGAAAQSTFTNISVTDATVEGEQKCGGIIGFIAGVDNFGAQYTRLSGCSVKNLEMNASTTYSTDPKSDVNGASFGGLFGFASPQNEITVTNCSVDNISFSGLLESTWYSGKSVVYYQYLSHPFIGALITKESAANKGKGYDSQVYTLTDNTVAGTITTAQTVTCETSNAFLGFYYNDSIQPKAISQKTKLIIDGTVIPTDLSQQQ